MTRYGTLTLGMLLLGLSGCPPTGVVCKPGTLPCGTGCIDPNADRRNCGQCGFACAAQQDCNQGTCLCRAGTVACADSTCVVTDYDAQNCGRCGVACAAGQVCERGQCQASCSEGFLQCLASCVDSANDTSNCGGCGVVCAQGQQCARGVCDYPVVAACYWSGQVVGFNPSTGARGPLSDVGTNPGALGRLGSTILSADGTDRRLYGATPSSTGSYLQTSTATQVGSVPNQVLVDRPYVYVANAGSGTLVVLKEGADAGIIRLGAPGEGELLLGSVAELPLGMNSFPEGVAKVGSSLWVPLYGGYGAEGADAGQALLEIDISNPEHPSVSQSLSLKALDLQPFDGANPVARPWSIVTWRDAVYVALNNLDPDSFLPAGPGLLVRVNPSTHELLTIDLGASTCLNPQALIPVGDYLAVSCGGRVTYGSDGAVTNIEAAGVVAIDALNHRLAQTWSAASLTCPPNETCSTVMPGRLAALGNQLLVADQNGGRVVKLQVDSDGVHEAASASSLQICPLNDTTHVANVADLLASP